jgi:hypothetical protein
MLVFAENILECQVILWIKVICHIHTIEFYAAKIMLFLRCRRKTDLHSILGHILNPLKSMGRYTARGMVLCMERRLSQKHADDAD